MQRPHRDLRACRMLDTPGTAAIKPLLGTHSRREEYELRERCHTATVNGVLLFDC